MSLVAYLILNCVCKIKLCFILKSWKEWSNWSECTDGTKQRTRTCDETSKQYIEKQPCFPMFHATYGQGQKGPQFELPRTLSEATNNNYKKLSSACPTDPSE